MVLQNTTCIHQVKNVSFWDHEWASDIKDLRFALMAIKP